MDLATYQQELRHAYVRGGPGALISGLAWLVSGIVANQVNIGTGFVVLFFGGMLIFPGSKVLLKLLFRREPESKSNPGALIVIETIFPMMGMLFAAWLMLSHEPSYVFSIAAIGVGVHYFGFRSAYGDWTYWVFGAVLCLIGFASISYKTPAAEQVPFIVAATEFVFGAWFILKSKEDSKPSVSN